MEKLFEDQIPLLKPWVGLEEWKALKDVILSGWISQGPKVQEFENCVASFIGVKHAVATNSCTTALHLALRVHGIKANDEVILPDFTCMADANAIIMAGGVPVFADIEEKTYNIDPEKIEDLITEKTKAILMVDQIGLPADIEKFIKIARKHNLVLIDDAATSLGAKYKDKYLGSHGITTTFSFHPRKMITTGEGGMLVTDDLQIAEMSRILRSTGASVSDLERHKAKGTILQEYHTNGYNYRMTDIQAAIGIVQMKKLPEMLRQRREQAKYYNKAFSNIEELDVPFVPSYATHAYSSYLLRLKTNSKLKVVDIINGMAEKNISCRFGIQPLHREPYFRERKFSDSDFPVTCKAAESTFFIPIFPGLSEKSMSYVVRALKDLLRKR